MEENAACNQRERQEYPSDVLLDVLHEAAGKGTGLFRLDVPTGVGKSYAAVNLVGRLVADSGYAKHKVVYLASQIKHLPKGEDVSRALKLAGLPASSRAEVLRVPSNFDMLSSALPKGKEQEVIPSEFFDEPSVQSLLHALNDCRRNQQLGYDFSEDVNAVYTRALSVAMQRFEREWRARLVEECKARKGDKPVTSNDMLALVRSDQRFSWLGKLYPTMFIGEAWALLLTYKKFLVPVHTLIDGTFTLFNGSLLNKAVVIMDEIDMSKTDILNHMCEEAARHPVDLPSLVTGLCHSLMLSQLPEDLFLGGETESVRRHLESDIEYAREIYDESFLKYAYKADEDLTAGESLFFDDHSNVAVNEHRYVRVDEKQSIKRLSASAEGGATLMQDLKGVFSLVRRLRKHLFTLASKRRSARKLMGDSALENEFRSILYCMGIHDENQVRFLMEDLYGTRSQTRIETASVAELQDNVGTSLYSHGLSCISLRDADTHSMNTEISVSTMGMTPESLLATLMKRARVLGLSATATLPSVLANYDEGYLSTHCPGGIDRIGEDDLRRLEAALEARNAAYGDGRVSIVASTIESSGTLGNLANIVECDDQLEAGQHLLDLMGGDGTEQYVRDRYARLLLAYAHFLGWEDAQSMIALFQAAPKEKKNGKFNQPVLESLCEVVRQRAVESEVFADPSKANVHVCFITDSKHFQEQFDTDIKPKLEAGDRVFLVAAYATVGAGVNLQYKDSGAYHTIQLDNLDMGGMRDFDAIYLDRPTHLPPEAGKKPTDLMKCMFELCELAECGEISRSMLWSSCRHALGSGRPDGLENLPSVRAKGTGRINQAIGRMCRTNRKPPCVHILLDKDIEKRIDVHALDATLLNPEFRAAMRALACDARPAASPLEQKAIATTVLMNERTTLILRRKRWTEDHMRMWRLWRSFVLEHPTLDDACPTTNAIAFAGYLYAGQPIGTYIYSDCGSRDGAEFQNIEISLDPQRRLAREVCAEAAQLTELVSIAEIGELFDARGWQKEWLPNPYIMSPVFFRNIYLGALGEEIGTYLLNKNLSSWRLEGIENPAHFEAFDARVAGTDIYVDFKHWAGPVNTWRNDIEHIKGKMEKVGASHVLICNLTSKATDGRSFVAEYDGRIQEVQYLVDVQDGRVAIENIAAIRTWLDEVAR